MLDLKKCINPIESSMHECIDKLEVTSPSPNILLNETKFDFDLRSFYWLNNMQLCLVAVHECKPI